MENRGIYAMYSFRSKQAYIYRSNRVKEIVGGSYLITQAPEQFLTKLKESKFALKDSYDSETPFDYKDGNQIIYIGGGNLYMYYKDCESYRKANRIFSQMLLGINSKKDELYPFGLQMYCSYTKDTGDFEYDWYKLHSNGAEKKDNGLTSESIASLPFIQLDRTTSQPVAYKKYTGSDKQEQSLECHLKERAYNEFLKINKESIIDNDDLCKQKGIESLLAIIYIDGNGIGERVKSCKTIDGYRKLTVEIQNIYVDNPIAAIETALQQHSRISSKYVDKAPYRKIVGGGDEITLICNAGDVPLVIDAYFNALRQHSGYTACAGAVIFHSHAPFAEMYKIAEECCENSKKLNRKLGGSHNFFDFHFCHSGMTNSLDVIRELQLKDYIMRPYLTDKTESDDSIGHFDEFYRIGKALCALKREHIKNLGSAITRGNSYFIEEYYQIESRNPNIFRLLNINSDDVEKRKYLYDVAEVYDIWKDWFEKGRSNSGEVNAECPK